MLSPPHVLMKNTPSARLAPTCTSVESNLAMEHDVATDENAAIAAGTRDIEKGGYALVYLFGYDACDRLLQQMPEALRPTGKCLLDFFALFARPKPAKKLGSLANRVPRRARKPRTVKK